MSNKHAFTLLETLVAAGLIVLVLIVSLSLRGTASQANKDISGLEEYYNLHSRLMNLLKHDLRAARSIKKVADKNYELDCRHLNPDTNQPEQQLITWQTAGAEQLIIERKLNGKLTQSFDFTSSAKGRKLKFEISNFD
ncbi:MAG: hypothetical protein ACD_39C01119G0005 [uncultured bacterium]|nr:MAG: hypothetical protein ACD_39C01119G0005 [uncultured bacterium]